MNRRQFMRYSTASTVAAMAAPRIARAQRRPNVLWVMFDDGRPDMLGCYGRPWANTPHIDGLAAEGVRFERCITQCPICVPSRTSLKTSRYAHETQVMYMGKPPETAPDYAKTPPPDFPNLLDCWSASGVPLVNTGKRHAFVNCWDDRGDPVQAKQPRPAEGKTYPPVQLTTHGWRIGGTLDVHPDDTQTGRLGALARATLAELLHADSPFFLRVSFHAPHVPIGVPPQYMVAPDSVALPLPTQEELDAKPRFEREQLRVYAGTLDLTPEALQIARGTFYGMAAHADREVGTLLGMLRAADALDNTIVAVTSDQGLQLGEHGLHKKRNFYEQTINSPLVLRYPERLPEGKTVSALSEMTDFLPTLLDLSGMAVPDDIRGRSLLPLVAGNDPGRAAVFAEIDHSGSMYDELRVHSGRRVMVQTDDYKLEYFKDARNPDKDGALYDLRTDPGETRNCYQDPGKAETIAHLEALVDAWDATT